MDKIFEKMYAASPIWMQQVAIAAYGWSWYRRRFSHHFYRLVNEFKEREYWTAGQFHEYQKQQLRNLFTAASHSPYYRQIFTEKDLRPEMDPLRVLKLMPILSKESLRTRGRELLTRKSLPKGTVAFKSSGTTGTPTEIWYTPEFHAMEVAVPEVRNLMWANLDHQNRRVMFGVRKVCEFNQTKPPFWRFSPAENMAYASIYHLSPQYLTYYVQFLHSYRPAIIMGYPSALNTIASHLLENRDSLHSVKAIFTTSETVTDDARARIEKTFQCKIYDRYCAVEMCVFASQCEHGSYHISPEVGLIEIVDSHGKEVPPGVIGEVICTGLQNTLQPLVRYRIGDIARWALNQNCPCGRSMPILESIEGRFEDICYTPDCREMLRFDTVFKGVENIREGQVVQDNLDSFSIYVVPANGFSSDDIELLKKNMQLHVGKVQTEVKSVDVIPRSGAGKFRAVVCKLSLDEKRRLKRLSAHHSQVS